MRLNSLLGISALVPSASLAATVPARGANRHYIEERDGVLHNVFQDSVSGMRTSFVNNSGICETTPGVNHYSGYISPTPDDNIWFWLFEARRNPEKAPLVLYFSGGPGCSSMGGTFVNNGPCRFDSSNQTEPIRNPYSYNEYANVLYIDQPMPTGFTYGNGTQPRTTKEAAGAVYDFLQAFYEQFPEYQGRGVGLFTSSYGGHYGPEFARLILERNEAVARGDEGTAGAHEIRLVALGIDNAWIDAGIQERANIEFAHKNEYQQIINDTVYERLVSSWESTQRPLLDECAATAADEACHDAYLSYAQGIEIEILVSGPRGWGSWDVRQGAQRVPTAEAYLQREDVQKAIGAETRFVECRWPAGFVESGDDARSFLDELSAVVRAGIKVLIWTGDADYVSNWFGTSEVAHKIDWPGRDAFAAKDLEPYTVGGQEKASFKTQDNLTYMLVFGAGHQMTWYQPELSLQVLEQFMGPNGLSST